MTQRTDLAHLIAYGTTDTGLVRSTNEDTFDIVDFTSGRHTGAPELVSCSLGARGVLLAVADGMGGEQAGEIASALAIVALRARLGVEGDDCSGAALREAIESANRDVWDAAGRMGKRGMGATLAAVLVNGTHAHIAAVGDSRVYAIRGREIAQLTKDQSYVELLVDAGVLTRAEAAASTYRNVILQAMGTSPQVDVALGRLDLRSGDVLVVCSDGLTNAVTDAEIRRTIEASPSIAAACARLVALARDRGGEDNITVVLAEIAGGALPGPRDGDTLERSFAVLHRFNPSLRSAA